MAQAENDPVASPDGRVLFVYYKVGEVDRARLLPVVQAFEQKIRQQLPLLSLELMQRPASSAGIETWMEIYRHDDGLPEAALGAVEELAHALGMPQPRLSEIFVPLRRAI